MSNKSIIEINAVPYGSTGKIVRGIRNEAQKSGYITYEYYGWTKKFRKSNNKNIYIGSFWGKVFHMLLSRISGYTGVFSIISTYKLIRKLRKVQPDIIHMHILHNWYINIPMIMKYIKKNNIATVWTLHDCWAFTGQCPHYSNSKCGKWKTGCFECSQIHNYPKTYVDKTNKMWNLKKGWFNGVENLTIVTPSKWLSEQVKESFLSEYPVKVINNGIDLAVFKRTPGYLKTHFNISKNKKIILGVAYGWGYKKGLDVFIELRKRLSEEDYEIVLVGTDQKTDKIIKDRIISIHRTNNQRELAEIYSDADVFVNPTREEVLGMVNIEANACGTPVITFNSGGSPECINDKSGFVVNTDDIDELIKKIKQCCENNIVDKKDCIKCAEGFDEKQKYIEYIELFESI